MNNKLTVFCLSTILSVFLTFQSYAAPALVTLTWNDDPMTTQVITWRDNPASNAGYIQYAENADSAAFPDGALQAPVPSRQLSGNAGTYNIYSGKLTGLKPGTRYLYRLGDGKNWSSPNSFVTAPYPPKPFGFLVFGDSQSYDYSVWGKTALNAYAKFPQSAFFCNAGDLVDYGNDYKQWFSWLKYAQGLINNISCVAASGNHESYNINGSLMRPDGFRSILALPQNGPDILKGVVYSLDYSNVHFVVLDSQYGEQAKSVPNLLQLQQEWLEKDLAGSKAQWKVVLMHRPLYNNCPGESHPALRSAFRPLFDKYHVDVVFNGHDHACARTYPLYDGKKTTTDRGTVYVNCGRSGTKSHKLGLASMSWDDFYFNPTGQPNYISVAVAGGTLQIDFWNQDGSNMDHYLMIKPD